MKAYLTQHEIKQRRTRRMAWCTLSGAVVAGAVIAGAVAFNGSPDRIARAEERDAQVWAALAHPRESQPDRQVSHASGIWGGFTKLVNAGPTRSERAPSPRDVFADDSHDVHGFEPVAMEQDGAVISNGAAEGKIELPVNRTTVLTTQAKYKTVSVGQPDIAEVTPLGPTTILVTARKPGATQVIIWDESDRSQVVDVVVSVDLDALREHIASSFPNADITVDALGGAIALRGTVPSVQTAEQIVASASPYSDRVLNFLEVSGGQQVMLQVRFLEMSRRASQELGINLAATLTNVDKTMQFVGPGVTTKVLNPAISTLTGSDTWGSFTLDYALSALKQNNLARVLAEPNVTVISGQEASLLAGGEFPVPVPQTGAGGGSTITIEYREFGVRLNVTPVVLGNGKIRLKVAPEVSDLDFSSPVVIENNNIPIINKRRVQSTVEMGDGQTFAIAGLMRSQVIATRNATPLLGELPVIGALFRSVRYQRDETELVVLVTPRLVEPMNPAEVPDIPGVKWHHPNPVEFYLNGELGKPAVKAPSDRLPPRFRGAYGFAPADGQVLRTASVE